MLKVSDLKGDPICTFNDLAIGDGFTVYGQLRYIKVSNSQAVLMDSELANGAGLIRTLEGCDQVVRKRFMVEVT